MGLPTGKRGPMAQTNPMILFEFQKTPVLDLTSFRILYIMLRLTPFLVVENFGSASDHRDHVGTLSLSSVRYQEEVSLISHTAVHLCWRCLRLPQVQPRAVPPLRTSKNPFVYDTQ
jgi:hypothetical protein